MTIQLNGKENALSEAVTLEKLLLENQVRNLDMISVQLNGKTLERNEFQTTSISDGDQVEVLYFMGGGS